jgi:hypothetical protein
MKIDFAHPHGDEFFAQADDERELARFFFQLQQVANRSRFPAARPGGWRYPTSRCILRSWHRIRPRRSRPRRPPSRKSKQGDNIARPRELDHVELERELSRLKREGYPEPVRVPSAAAERVGEGGAGVRQAESPQEVDPESLAEIRQSIARMRGKNREVASAFLDYVLDPESHPKPIIDERLQQHFLDEYGLYDPLSPPEVDLRTGRGLRDRRSAEEAARPDQEVRQAREADRRAAQGAAPDGRCP